MKKDKSEDLLIVSDWSSQPWCLLFRLMLSSEPIIFERNKNLVTRHAHIVKEDIDNNEHIKRFFRGISNTRSS